MLFHTFVFDSDYLEAKLISLENCCLLSTKLPMKHPKVFFSRNPFFDCQCEILVIEVGGEDDLAKFRRTQKQAKTVLVAVDALSGLDTFLGLGRKCSTALVDANNTLVEIEGGEDASQASDIASGLPQFIAECGITDVVNSWECGSSLDSRVLRKTSWLVGTFVSKKVLRNEEEKASLSSIPCSSEGNSSSAFDVIFPQNTEKNNVNNDWAICCQEDRKFYGDCHRIPPTEKPANSFARTMKTLKRTSISSSAPAVTYGNDWKFEVSGLMRNPKSYSTTSTGGRSRLTKARYCRGRVSTSHLKLLYLGEDGCDVESADCATQPHASFCDGWISVTNGDHIYRAKTSARRSLYDNIKSAVKYVRREKRNSHHDRPQSHSK